MLRWLALLPVGSALVLFACSSDPAAEDPGGDGPDAASDGAAGNDDGGTGGDGGTQADGNPDPVPEVPLVPPKSGTRLKARFDKLASNLLAFRDIYDSVLQTTCQEQTTPDGKLRCVPHAESGSYYYADASCQTRLVGATPGVCLKKYAWASTDPTGCTGGVGYYEIGAPYVGAAYRKTVNGCVAATTTGTDLYQLGAAIPDATFAEVAIEHTALAPYAQASVLTSADGLKVWRGGLYDPNNKVTASVTLAGDNKMRVLPYAPLTVNRFKGNENCNIALASGSIRCGKDPSGLASFQPSLQIGCEPQKTSLYTIGPKYTGQLYNPAAQCAPVAKPADTEVYEVGAAVDLNLFALATPKNLGDAKVEAATYSIGGFSQTPGLGTLTDKVLNLRCSMQNAVDGTRRCMPYPAAIDYFTDAQCTQLVFGRYPQYSSCGPKPVSYGLAPEAGCNPKVKLHALGAATSPAAVWRRNEKGACEPVSKNGLQFFAVGAEIAPSTLPEGKLVE